MSAPASPHTPWPGLRPQIPVHAGDEAVRVSFEFFPPKNEAMETRLAECVAKLAPLHPAFVSVTYGAGGSTRERTHRTVRQIAKDNKLSVAAHLTCVGARRANVDAVARDYLKAGITHIVALRGDPVEGVGARYVPFEGGYAHACDLVAGLKKIGDFEISVAGYPERHPESSDWKIELDNLKRKVDAGASRIITQFCFDADTMVAYIEKVRDAGISIPVVPGIMLQPNFVGLVKMARVCGAHIPKRIRAVIDGPQDDEQTRRLLSAAMAADYCSRLYAHGLRDFHFYTLNQADLAYATCRLLGLSPDQEDAGS